MSSEEIPKFIMPGFEEAQKNIMNKLQPYVDQWTLATLKLRQLPPGCKEQETALRSMIGWCAEQVQEILMYK